MSPALLWLGHLEPGRGLTWNLSAEDGVLLGPFLIPEANFLQVRSPFLPLLLLAQRPAQTVVGRHSVGGAWEGRGGTIDCWALPTRPRPFHPRPQLTRATSASRWDPLRAPLKPSLPICLRPHDGSCRVGWRECRFTGRGRCKGRLVQHPHALHPSFTHVPPGTGNSRLLFSARFSFEQI